MDSLARCYDELDQPDLSIMWYERALEIFQKDLPAQEDSLAAGMYILAILSMFLIPIQ